MSRLRADSQHFAIAHRIWWLPGKRTCASRFVGLGRRIEGDSRFGGEVEERKGFLQIEANVRVRVTQVADRRVLADLKIEVTAAGRDDKGPVNGGRPEDLPVDE